MIRKETFAASAMWKIIEAVSTKGVSLIISVILARILFPEAYGIIALTNIFISLTTIIVQSGLSAGLIRKEYVDEIDYNNAFYIGFVFAAICYILFFLISPVIASFYEEPVLIIVLRVQMLSLFLCAFGNVQTAIITREFRFRELCIANVIANSVSGMAGVILACLGAGVWALVICTLSRDAITNAVLFMRIKWRPTRHIERERMKSLAGFSMFLLMATLVDFIGNNYSSALLGKRYSMSDLGLYSKGNQLPEMICLQVFGAVSSVMLPAFSSCQNDAVALKRICKKNVSVSCYLIFPMMTGLALIGEKLIPFLFTEKWSACVPILIFACVYYGLNPLRSINMQLIYALGEPKKGVFIEVIRMLLLIIGVSIAVFVLETDIYGISAVSAGVAIINVIITQLFTRNKIEYKYFEWLKDMAAVVFLCLCMAIAVGLTGRLPIQNDSVIMFMQIFVGIAVYLAGSMVTKNVCYQEVAGLLKQKIKTSQTGR